MPAIQIHETAQSAFISTLETIISRIVETNAGIRDLALSVCVLVETADHPTVQKQRDATYAAATVAWTVHRMIAAGQLIAIDCETSTCSYTYLLPPDASVTVTEPLRINPNSKRAIKGIRRCPVHGETLMARTKTIIEDNETPTLSQFSSENFDVHILLEDKSVEIVKVMARGRASAIQIATYTMTQWPNKKIEQIVSLTVEKA